MQAIAKFANISTVREFSRFLGCFCRSWWAIKMKRVFSIRHFLAHIKQIQHLHRTVVINNIKAACIGRSVKFAKIGT